MFSSHSALRLARRGHQNTSQFLLVLYRLERSHLVEKRCLGHQTILAGQSHLVGSSAVEDQVNWATLDQLDKMLRVQLCQVDQVHLVFNACQNTGIDEVCGAVSIKWGLA